MIERILPFTGWFESSLWPDALCPNCGLGTLRADTAQKHESTTTYDARDHEAWEPEWIRGYFTCVLKCQRQACREITVAMGLWEVREVHGKWGPDYGDFYRLQMTVPPLPIVKAPPSCPGAVNEAVSNAARVVWVDPSAAAGRLRVAIELVLDDKRIPRRPRGTAQPLKLHARIERLRKTNSEVADLLEAVKWIGNQGSHEDTLSARDVVEGARVLELALTLLYDKAPEAIRRHAKQIIRAKGVKTSRGTSRL